MSGEAQYHRFVTYMNSAYALFYPASYEYLQAQWVKENNVKAGTKVRVTRTFTEDEDGSCCWEHDDLVGMTGVVGDYGIAHHSLGIDMSDGSFIAIPYFALEVIKEPTYRPFANAEEFASHRDGCWISRKEGVYQRMLVIEYSNAGIRVGGSFIIYRELVRDYIFVDTGEPAGVKI